MAGPRALVFGDRAFDDAVFGADPSGGQEMGENVVADGAGQVGARAGDDAGGQDELIAGGGESGGEAGPVGVGARDAVGGVGHRGP
ncbi:hypothetical protein [Streptomyces sp. NPDC086010]|uniref:hypothetical protein n=1 Tax=Streptomyces sp. NPDC086010 TaxID=3365745 RepID=UPI0037CD8506